MHSRNKTKYKISALVLSKNSKKLARKGRTGPYRMKEVLSEGTFRLSNEKDNVKILTILYNITRLKLYYDTESSNATN